MHRGWWTRKLLCWNWFDPPPSSSLGFVVWLNRMSWSFGNSTHQFNHPCTTLSPRVYLRVPLPFWAVIFHVLMIARFHNGCSGRIRNIVRECQSGNYKTKHCCDCEGYGYRVTRHKTEWVQSSIQPPPTNQDQKGNDFLKFFSIPLPSWICVTMMVGGELEVSSPRVDWLFQCCPFTLSSPVIERRIFTTIIRSLATITRSFRDKRSIEGWLIFFCFWISSLPSIRV